jgi:nicotinamide-nucleotide amidase
VLDEATRQIADVMGPDLFSTDGRSMEQIVGALLGERGLKIAVGESCTGGLIASRLTDVPGSSKYFELGVVAYGNRAKIDLLGVPEALIDSHGAVSEPVALAMAVGVGIGVTGIAGPGGGSDRKPVGTVAVGVVGPAGERVRTYLFPGGREQIKAFAAQAALDGVRRLLIGAGTRDEGPGTWERDEGRGGDIGSGRFER